MRGGAPAPPATLNLVLGHFACLNLEFEFQWGPQKHEPWEKTRGKCLTKLARVGTLNRYGIHRRADPGCTSFAAGHDALPVLWRDLAGKRQGLHELRLDPRSDQPGRAAGE